MKPDRYHRKKNYYRLILLINLDEKFLKNLIHEIQPYKKQIIKC
jgi:hypothetical protein